MKVEDPASVRYSNMEWVVPSSDLTTEPSCCSSIQNILSKIISCFLVETDTTLLYENIKYNQKENKTKSLDGWNYFYSKCKWIHIKKNFNNKQNLKYKQSKEKLHFDSTKRIKRQATCYEKWFTWICKSLTVYLQFHYLNFLRLTIKKQISTSWTKYMSKTFIK